MPRTKAQKAWQARVARHEDSLTAQTDDLIAEGIRAFLEYRSTAKKGDQEAVAEQYRRLVDLVEQARTHPLIQGVKPGHRIRRAQYLCLAFFVSREYSKLDEAEHIINQLIQEEDKTSEIHISARSILALIVDLRG